MWRLVAVAIFSAGLMLIKSHLGAPSSAEWQQVGPGVEMRVLHLNTQDGGATAVKIVALRCSPRHIHIVCGRTLDAAGWRETVHGIAAVNGGFFDTAGKSLGLRIGGSRTLSRLRRVDGGVFFIAGGQARVAASRGFPTNKSIRQAVQCSPRLVAGGKAMRVKPQSARRTGIGVQEDGKVVLAVSQAPISLPEWAALWASSGGLNCRDALNLDGGGSTQLSLRSSTRHLEIDGLWAVPDALVVK